MNQNKHQRIRTYPTAAQFEANPQAKQIRDVCLEAATILHRLRQNEEADVSAASACLERLNGRLIELGCWSNMEINLSQLRYREPLTMARYVAGQFMEELGERVVSQQQIVPIIQEFAQHHIGPITALVMKGSDLPSPVRSYVVSGLVLEDLCHFLDAKLLDD